MALVQLEKARHHETRMYIQGRVLVNFCFCSQELCGGSTESTSGFVLIEPLFPFAWMRCQKELYSDRNCCE